MALRVLIAESPLDKHFREAAEKSVPQHDIFENTLMFANQNDMDPHVAYSKHLAYAMDHLGIAIPVDLPPAKKYTPKLKTIFHLPAEQHADLTHLQRASVPSCNAAFDEVEGLVSRIHARAKAEAELIAEEEMLDTFSDDWGLVEAMEFSLITAKEALASVKAELIPQA